MVIGRYQGTVVVTVHGELDRSRAVRLGHMLADLIDGQGNLSVVVDLHAATETDTDTEVVSVLADAADRAGRRGGLMTVGKPPPHLDEGLRHRGLGHLVEPRSHLRERQAHPAGRSPVLRGRSKDTG
jgi:anti-anti-sigma regulatory factor